MNTGVVSTEVHVNVVHCIVCIRIQHPSIGVNQAVGYPFIRIDNQSGVEMIFNGRQGFDSLLTIPLSLR